MQVRATDRSGNVGAWSPGACSTRPLDDRALTVTAGSWSLRTGDSFYLHTVSSAQAAGARLVRRGAQVRTLALVATTCASCGSVAVKVVDTKIWTLDLHSETTKNRVVLLLPSMALRAGTVKVTSVTPGAVVRIDGLVVSRATAP